MRLSSQRRVARTAINKQAITTVIAKAAAWRQQDQSAPGTLQLMAARNLHIPAQEAAPERISSMRHDSDAVIGDTVHVTRGPYRAATHV